LYTSLTSIDRLVVSAKLGFEAIGLYTPSILILQGMAVLPSSVMQVIYPKAVELYSRTGSAKVILPLIFKPIPFLVLLQLPVAFFLWIYLPDIIKFVMPKFTAGTEAAQWTVVAGSILALSSPALAFNVLKKQFHYGVIMLLSGLVVYTSANYFISIEYGLASVAIATTLGFAVFVIVCSLVSYFICTGKSK
jgi:O-antigen/teichoic acid export membrane protein